MMDCETDSYSYYRIENEITNFCSNLLSNFAGVEGGLKENNSSGLLVASSSTLIVGVVF
jgi:hypothetical protein